MKERWMTGPLGAHVPGFGEELARLGYAARPARRHLQLLSQLSSWLEVEELEPAGLSSTRVVDFLDARRAQGHSRLVTAVGVAPMLGYLRRLGVIPEPSRPTPVGPVEELLERYHLYLVDQRGLVEQVVAQAEAAACLFLRSFDDGPGPDWAEVSAADVTRFMTRECSKRGEASAQTLAWGLRSFLRFAHVEGIISVPLAQAVPSVAGWSGASLPRALAPGEAARLLRSCDRRTAAGRRDYAILVLLVRLGLRAGEVCAMQLDDIDWRAGEVVVHGKGRRDERLPLPVDAGEAIAGYLRQGRPQAESRAVFLRLFAPRKALTRGAVSWVVYNACERAGLPRVGAHRLRHTAATEMLRSGATLAEVGQVLRHRQAGTTAIYAKVDRGALAGLARPWPGGGA